MAEPVNYSVLNRVGRINDVNVLKLWWSDFSTRKNVKNAGRVPKSRQPVIRRPILIEPNRTHVKIENQSAKVLRVNDDNIIRTPRVYCFYHDYDCCCKRVRILTKFAFFLKKLEKYF